MQSTLKGQSFPPLPFPFTSIYNYLTFPWGSTNHRPSVPCHDKNNCRSIIRRLVSPSSTFPAAFPSPGSPFRHIPFRMHMTRMPAEIIGYIMPVAAGAAA